MTNRLFYSRSSCFGILNRRNSLRPFNFARKQQLAFAAEIEQQLAELEKRFACQPLAPLVSQQSNGTAVSATNGNGHPCTYDDFGLVEGLEIDVSWM